MVFGRRPAESTEWLSGVAFFDGFTDSELERVRRLFTEVELPSGAVVMDQGDPGTYCYVIVEGEVTIYVRGEQVNTAGPGDVVGEMALVDHQPRTATVIAATSLKLLRFGTRDFNRLLDEMPKANERIMGTLRARLEQT
jgi:CRP/FNR family transcriptional regulator, cyclic AMP receptor protein